MGEPIDNELIENELQNVSITRGWSGVLKYDVLFTDQGMLFRHIGDTVTRTGGASFSVGGVNVTQAARLIKKVTDPQNEGMRSGYQGLSLKQMLGKDKKNFYVSNGEVSSVAVKKKIVGAEICFETSDGKVKCEMPAEMMENARTIVSKRLGNKIAA